MKILRKLPILPLIGIGASVVLTNCGTLDKLKQPLSDTGYNPLDKPGMTARGGAGAESDSDALVNSNDHGFNNGDIVEVVIPNTALFAAVPKAGDRYKQVLNVGDTLRVIGGEKDFIKVVTETGQTGFVSSVMVVTQGFLTNTGSIDPNVTAVGADETPIVPDVAPDPIVPGIGAPDPTPGDVPTPVPSIIAPLPLDPDPGLLVPETPVDPTLDIPVPEIPDPTPVEPSLPDTPAPEPSSPGLPE